MKHFSSRLWVLLFFCSFPGLLPAQQSIDWKVLEQLHFEEVSEAGGRMPVFEETLQAFNGEMVTIEGYMLPLTVDNELFILSRYPFYNCYFCGNAGRETVIELKPLNPDWKFEIDDEVKIRGVLELVEDPVGLIFILRNAEEID